MNPDLSGGLFPYDYCYLWAAGKVVLSGGNVYDQSLLSQTMYQVGWPIEEGVWGFTHPPWTIWLYLPFSLLSFPYARILWLIFLCGLLGLIGLQCLHLRKIHPETFGRLSSPLMVFALLLFPGTIKNFAFGQSSLMLALSLLLFLRYSLSHKTFAAGMILSLTFLKPHLLLPFYCAVFTNGALRRDWGLFIGATAGLLIQQSICTLVYPMGVSYFLDYVPHLLLNSTILPGTTIAQIFARFFDIFWMRAPLLIAGILVGVIAGARKTFSLVQTTQWLVPLSLLVAPYCFSHEFVLLIPSYLFVLCALVERFGEKIRFAIPIMGLAMVFIIVNTNLEFITILLPLSLFFAVIYLQRQRNRGLVHQSQ